MSYTLLPINSQFGGTFWMSGSLTPDEDEEKIEIILFFAREPRGKKTNTKLCIFQQKINLFDFFFFSPENGERVSLSLSRERNR
jgi:hypothetical protein